MMIEDQNQNLLATTHHDSWFLLHSWEFCIGRNSSMKNIAIIKCDSALPCNLIHVSTILAQQYLMAKNINLLMGNVITYSFNEIQVDI